MTEEYLRIVSLEITLVLVAFSGTELPLWTKNIRNYIFPTFGLFHKNDLPILRDSKAWNILIIDFNWLYTRLIALYRSCHIYTRTWSEWICHYLKRLTIKNFFREFWKIFGGASLNHKITEIFSLLTPLDWMFIRRWWSMFNFFRFGQNIPDFVSVFCMFLSIHP